MKCVALAASRTLWRVKSVIAHSENVTPDRSPPLRQSENQNAEQTCSAHRLLDDLSLSSRIVSRFADVPSFFMSTDSNVARPARALVRSIFVWMTLISCLPRVMLRQHPQFGHRGRMLIGRVDYPD